MRREIRSVRAREAGGEEYDRLWRMVVAAYAGYEACLTWAHRGIPLVVPDPAYSPAARPNPGAQTPHDHND